MSGMPERVFVIWQDRMGIQEEDQKQAELYIFLQLYMYEKSRNNDVTHSTHRSVENIKAMSRLTQAHIISH